MALVKNPEVTDVRLEVLVKNSVATVRKPVVTVKRLSVSEATVPNSLEMG